MKKIAALLVLIISTINLFSQDWRLIKVKEWENDKLLPLKIISKKYLYEFNSNETQVTSISDSIASVPLHKVTHNVVNENRLHTATYKYGQYIVIYRSLIIFVSLTDGTEIRRLNLAKSINKFYSINIENDEVIYQANDGKYYNLNLCEYNLTETEINDEEEQEEEVDTFFNNIDTINLGGDYYLEVVGNKCYAYHKISHVKSEIFTNNIDFVFDKIFVNKSGNKLFLMGEAQFWIINKDLKIDTVSCDFSKYFLSEINTQFFIDDVNFYGLQADYLGAPAYFRVIDLKSCELKFERKITEGPYPSLYINDINSDKYIFVKVKPLSQNADFIYLSFNIEKKTIGGGDPFEGVIGGPEYVVSANCGDYYFLLDQVTVQLSGWRYQVSLQKTGNSKKHLLWDVEKDFALESVYFSECSDKSLYFITNEWRGDKFAIWLFEYDYNDTTTVIEIEPLDCVNHIISSDDSLIIENDLVYSNLVKNEIILKNDFKQLIIFNSYGQLVQSFNNVRKDQSIIFDLSHGLYFLQGISNDKKLYSCKIINTQ